MPRIWDFIKNIFGGQPKDPAAGAGTSPAPGAVDANPAAPPAPGSVASSDRKAAAKKGPRSYTAPDILALSPEEWRRRALRIVPWRTAWIGRTDTIPPQSDERTALIDRGLVLNGKLTEPELAEIHQVGDLWLHFHERVKLAKSRAEEAGREAVEARKRERALLVAKKKAESAERRRLRAEAVVRRRETDIVFLGRGVSRGLADRRTNVEKVAGLGLPVLATPRDVADLFGISIRRLRWLAFHTEAAERAHYVYFEVPKRSGGTRLLAAPHRELKRVQKKLLTEILEKLPMGAPAHGFVKGRSTVTNAEPHVGSTDVVNLDISNFFPTITFRRVRGLFRGLGYSPCVATILALLATECPRVPIEYEGKRWMVAVGERALPQGAPSSPAISNLVSRRLDKRLSALARKAGWRYTRYADDLTFSVAAGAGGGKGGAASPWLMRQVEDILASEGFRIHPKKRRRQRRARRQEVTGIVVNQKLSVPREEVRRLRAILHGARKTGLAAQNREGREGFPAWLRGKLAYVAMIDPEKGKKMLAELDQLEGRA